MKYISDLNISFSLLVNGVDKRFSFSPRTQGGSMYIAKSKAEIKALESSNMYGRIYRRAEDQPVELKTGKRGRPAKQEQTVKDVNSITSWQEAIDYLSENFGSSRENLRTPDEILMEAVKKGVRFVNLK